jgi:hypothetical protein
VHAAAKRVRRPHGVYGRVGNKYDCAAGRVFVFCSAGKLPKGYGSPLVLLATSVIFALLSITCSKELRAVGKCNEAVIHAAVLQSAIFLASITSSVRFFGRIFSI